MFFFILTNQKLARKLNYIPVNMKFSRHLRYVSIGKPNIKLFGFVTTKEREKFENRFFDAP